MKLVASKRQKVEALLFCHQKTLSVDRAQHKSVRTMKVLIPLIFLEKSILSLKKS